MSSSDELYQAALASAKDEYDDRNPAYGGIWLMWSPESHFDHVEAKIRRARNYYKAGETEKALHQLVDCINYASFAWGVIKDMLRREEE